MKVCPPLVLGLYTCSHVIRCWPFSNFATFHNFFYYFYLFFHQQNHWLWSYKKRHKIDQSVSQGWFNQSHLPTLERYQTFPHINLFLIISTIGFQASFFVCSPQASRENPNKWQENNLSDIPNQPLIDLSSQPHVPQSTSFWPDLTSTRTPLQSTEVHIEEAKTVFKSWLIRFN